MGVEKLCKLLSSRIPDQIEQFILLLRENQGLTKKEIMESLAISEKQFKNIAKKLREIGLLYTRRDKNNVAHYYLSYEGFSYWLKTLRDSVYNLLKR